LKRRLLADLRSLSVALPLQAQSDVQKKDKFCYVQRLQDDEGVIGAKAPIVQSDPGGDRRCVFRLE
jgi:hypothetical protein